MNRQLLERPFAPEQIKRRQGTNGDVLDYIEGCAVIQRLNECFDAEWIFEIQEHRVYEDEVVVLGKLTAQSVTKSQFGKSRITKAKKDNAVISLGDDLKAAATDCLKSVPLCSESDCTCTLMCRRRPLTETDTLPVSAMAT